MWLEDSPASRAAIRKSPDSLSADSRRSTNRAAPATVFVSSSRVEGILAPTALTCAPSPIHPRSMMGSRAEVAVTMISASLTAALADSADSSVKRTLLRQRVDEACDVLRVRTPHSGPGEWPHGCHGREVRACLNARSENRKLTRFGERKEARSHRRDRRSSDSGDGGSIHHRLQLAGLAVVKEDSTLVAIEPAGWVRPVDQISLSPKAGLGSER